MTDDEQRLAIAYSERDETRAKIAALEAENSKAQEDIYIFRCDVGAAQKTASQCIEEIKHLRAKIEALEAENAALRKRLVVDEAMVDRAQKARTAALKSIGLNAFNRDARITHAALTAALANKDDPT